MIDILETLERWQRDGRRIAIATVVAVEFSAPRDPGAVMAVNDRGEVAGSVSGGCVEGAVYEEAQEVLKTGRPRLVTYGISDSDAVSVGLTCGGTIHIFVEALDGAILARVARAVREDAPIALAIRLDADPVGAELTVRGDRDETYGGLGTAGLDYAVTAEARAVLAGGDTVIRTFGQNGEPTGVDVRVFIRSFAPRPNMYIFGAVDFTRAMVHVGKDLGYRVTVVDARPVFATRQRFAQADEVIVAWPDEFLSRAPVDARTVVIVLTHDAKFDVPLLQVALGTRAGYIGAMGSRRTHADRLAQLRAAGVAEEDLARINAPIGLDIGARTPEETAISIAAEIIASRAGREGGRLSRGTEPVHPAPRAPVARSNAPPAGAPLGTGAR
jgi:xanthine dehydrogenase accessory factor